jgi:hypothetical protein
VLTTLFAWFAHHAAIVRLRCAPGKLSAWLPAWPRWPRTGRGSQVGGDPVGTPWDPGLRKAMRFEGHAVHEETVGDQIVADLGKYGPGGQWLRHRCIRRWRRGQCVGRQAPLVVERPEPVRESHRGHPGGLGRGILFDAVVS